MRKLLFLLAIVSILALVSIAQAQEISLADQEKTMEFRVERMAAQVAMLDQQITESLKKRQDLKGASDELLYL